ncbi:MAG: hypothetical protein DWP92_00790 [Armatimonadetes bacterium]|nr:MAG: hypothetical protein DWP92_00790 [Armatimonadota bacterium]
MIDPDQSLHESHPDLGLLLTGGSALIEAALDGSTTLESDVRPVQVRFVPGRTVVVQYSASVSTRGEGKRVETFVASTGQTIPAQTAVVSHKGTAIAVWVAAADPFLPGMRSVSSPRSAGQLLEQIGIEANDVTVRRRAYRPGRRAVTEIRTATARVFAKTVRPERVAGLQRLHTSLVSHAPIPASLGWSETSGIAVLQALEGQTLREVMTTDAPSLPPPANLTDLLRTMRHAEIPARTRPGLVQRVRDHASLIATITPTLSERTHLLARSIEEAATPDTTRTIHGDFHASQIIVNRGTVTGLVDIDTVGSGEPTDDLANFLAHLDAVASATPQSANQIMNYGAEVIRHFDGITDPRQLRLRVAAALLGYATGPFRVQEHDWRAATEARLARAEHWLAAASPTST